MSTKRLFLLGFFTVVIAVVLLSRSGTTEPAALREAVVNPDDLQPELFLERPEVPRKAAYVQAPIPSAPSTTPVSTPPSIADLTTVVEVEKWLENHAAHMADAKQWSRKDPLIDEFARVPSRYWGVMLEKSKQFTGKARAFTQEGLSRSAGTEHRDLVLQAFPEQLFLIAVITRHGWVADCAVDIRHKLADQKFTNVHYGDLNALIAALATLQDERDFHRFLVLLREHHFGYWQARIARSLATIPSFDLDTAVQSAWRRHAVKAYPDRQDGFAVVAARVGIAEALAITVLHAAGGKGTAWSGGDLQDEARALLKDQLGLHVDPDDPSQALRWWESAKDQVHWDAQARRWLGPPPPTPTIPANAVPPPIADGANDF